MLEIFARRKTALNDNILPLPKVRLFLLKLIAFETGIEPDQPAHQYSLTRFCTINIQITKIDNRLFQKWKVIIICHFWVDDKNTRMLTFHCLKFIFSLYRIMFKTVFQLSAHR